MCTTHIRIDEQQYISIYLNWTELRVGKFISIHLTSFEIHFVKTSCFFFLFSFLLRLQFETLELFASNYVRVHFTMYLVHLQTFYVQYSHWMYRILVVLCIYHIVLNNSNNIPIVTWDIHRKVIIDDKNVYWTNLFLSSVWAVRVFRHIWCTVYNMFYTNTGMESSEKYFQLFHILTISHGFMVHS